MYIIASNRNNKSYEWQ